MDTITAIATAPGLGAVGVVKVAGPGVTDIISALGWPLKPRHPVLVNLKTIDGDTIDSGLLIYFPGPNSYTGDDTLEFQGHGGPVVLNQALERFVQLGARLARPGEFSERAFLNDKLDLAQAEAVADLISASSAEAAKRAIRSLEGEFSRQVQHLYDAIVHLRIYVEAAIDFPEEEIDFLADGKVAALFADIETELAALRAQARAGQRFNDGIRILLIGKPNAGKSSLLNALSGRDSAIVTPIAGTTRDVLTEHINLNGLPAEIIDTAGLRHTDDPIEAEGVRRALKALETADIVLYLADAAVDRGSLENDLRDLLPPSVTPDLILWNKSDLVDVSHNSDHTLSISAATGAGLDQLIDRIKTLAGITPHESGFLARARHVDALDRCAHALTAGRAQLDGAMAGELLAEDLKWAHDCLGEITGKMTADDLLGEIFSSFCIGK